MARKDMGKARIVLVLFILFLVAQPNAAGASADYEKLLKDIPGLWTYSAYSEEQAGGEEPAETDLAYMTFEENGNVTLSCFNKEGDYAYSCEGSWSLENVPDMNDVMTIRYTSTDNPSSQADSEYSLECVYEVYMESWIEDVTEITYFICTPVSSSGTDPFADAYGEWEVALHREQGPNMRVVKCKDYVSLREKRSTSSKRLAKVPLDALVLAYPELGEEKGFIACVYNNEEGYILSEYLQPIE